jgi:hypothetical protein
MVILYFMTKPPTIENTWWDSRCICSRGWPSRSSMSGEALGPVKVLCQSIGECLGQEAGVCGLGNRVWGERIVDFQRGN